MGSKLKAWTAGFALATTACIAQGAIINGSFESGSFSPGWGAVQGNVVVGLAKQGGGLILPTDGDHFAYAETSSALSIGIASQSAISITAAESVLNFDWRFFTDEIPVSNNNDFFRLTITPQNSGPISVGITDVNSFTLVSGGPITAQNPNSGLSNGYDRTTNWTSGTVNLSSYIGGTVNLFFEVLDAGNGSLRSGFALDNVRLTPIPEPTMLGLLAIGVPMLLARRRSNRA